MKEWFEDKQLLIEDLPDGWREEIVSEDDERINPDSWKLGQVGMITVNGKTIIKPVYQDGVERGKFRVILIEPTEVQHNTDSFHQDILD